MRWTCGGRAIGGRARADIARTVANHIISAGQKGQAIDGSSDRAFRGDSSRYNPEELLVAALSSCHMLAYLHVCADAGVVVTAYEDAAKGTMKLNRDGSGEFTQVVLSPVVTLLDSSQEELANELHHKAHELCFIARSVNFDVRCEPSVRAASATARQ